MKEIIEQKNSAKVFTDKIDEFSESQIQTLCDQEFIKDSKIRIMPDVHAGAGCTIGTTMTIKDKVVPNLVGVDIGCGMETIELVEDSVDLEMFDKFIYDNIPSGMNVAVHPIIPNENTLKNILKELINIGLKQINHIKARKKN